MADQSDERPPKHFHRLAGQNAEQMRFEKWAKSWKACTETRFSENSLLEENDEFRCPSVAENFERELFGKFPYQRKWAGFKTADR